ncbi:MAG: FAD-dependent oxidoreductase [Acidobacteriota bacterium]
MSSEIANVVVIGGGVVGTSIAAEIASRLDNVFLIESRPRLGQGASTRNSGVIHAGIYYQPGSLKAFHCVRGQEMLYDFCAEHDIPHRRCGKLIVADDLEHLHLLEELKARGEENGVLGLVIVDAAFIRRIEPEIASPIALYSPNTGIIEAEGLIATLANMARERGAHLLTSTPLTGATVERGMVRLTTPREEVSTRFVVNAAGLYADEVARMFGFEKHTIYPCRGEYAELLPARCYLVNNLVYPLPLPSGHGLGVHFTKTVAGSLLVGPNSRYVAGKENYEEGREELNVFYESARVMMPSLKLEDLRLSYSGLRARLLPEQDHSFADFVMTRDPQWPSVIHLIGMESPGLTSCLSIARSVAEMVGA